MSIMFPTIFALSIKDLGRHTKKASSFLIMSIVGGAIVPVIMGLLADQYSTAIAYVIPLICFLVVLFYGLKGHKVKIAI
jgi:FHS family L-fucose permease-like MFS transporter